ncbi:wax ester/triacylglycerol synthase domain-containing protein [Nonomuraea fuscirosea]|uniref:wax ester/triacylglycerol synthase domain-containing protein n=1 Tax=Nonomuraea fuscirosea TaxID=1291556 RepID=UPI00341773A0
MGDLLNLVMDVGPVPMQVGACLVVDAGPGFSLGEARRLIGGRVEAVRRLRQRLMPVPFGCGRPVWVDDPAFDLDNHLQIMKCPAPGDVRALLDLAAQVIARPLRPGRPLWSITLVTGLDGDRAGLIVCFHHVLADGIGGLAVLGSLVDGAPVPSPMPFPEPAPSPRRIAAEAWTARLRALACLPRAAAALGRAVAELGPPAQAARCSLLQPVGPGQRLETVTTRLDDVRRYAHAHGGTVNDALLAAVTGALHTLLAGRGESVPELVVSVPVSIRATTTSDRLGNRIGIMPVRLPAGGPLAQRLERTAAATRRGKAVTSGASTGLVTSLNRILAGAGLLRRLLDRQRLIHTVCTNLRGPREPLTLNGATVTAMIPISLTRGNVSVVFSALSYAGTLTITVTADAGRTPDLPVLLTALHGQLAAMSRGTGRGNSSRQLCDQGCRRSHRRRDRRL